MEKNDKMDLGDRTVQSSQESKSDVESSEVVDDLSVAIEFIESGKPLVLNEGFLITDSGNLILSQYVDIGAEKLGHRPSAVVKFIEAKYGLEHALEIQVSAPNRFRDYGETFIQDDQEGCAKRETRTESPSRSYEEHDREQERALSLLGQKEVTIKSTKSPHSHCETESLAFGGSSWIFCTSIETTPYERSLKRAKLPCKYDHETVIRQPRKFSLALGEMFVDQWGPQGKRADSTHPGGFKSFHNSQVVLHGPVWYTEDVIGFLESRQSEPLYYIYALFLKHSKYQEQQEYRFVLNCETPVEIETLHLKITGAMRDSLAPPRTSGHVTFKRIEDASANSSSGKVSGPTPTHRTMTQTRNWSNNSRRTLRVEGRVAQEEIITSKQTIVLTTEFPADSVAHAESILEALSPWQGKITDSETRERRVEGEVTDKETNWRTRTFIISDTSDAEELFSLEERDNTAEILEAVGRPFTNFSSLPKEATEVLKALAHQAEFIEPNSKVPTMSACWNGIWVICNLYECYGDVVAYVGIEHDEFVAIALKQSEDTGAEGKILVGPNGTIAYVLTRGDEKHPGNRGRRDRLVFFPDEEARAAFKIFGWYPLHEDNSE